MLKIVGLLIFLSVTTVNAQSTLTWFSSSPPVQDFNPISLPGSGTPRLGVLVQVIATPTAPGGLTTAPTTTLFGVAGVNGGDMIVFEDQIGVANGNLFNQQTLATMGLGVADNVFLRLWNGFATGDVGGIPMMSATAGSLAYYDTPVVNINSLPAFGLMFQYDTGPIATTSTPIHASGSWVTVDDPTPVELLNFEVD